MVPKIFYQLYAIHVVYRNAVIPVVFAVLPNKTQDTYQRLISKLHELRPEWKLRSIMMDFEKASINAFSSTFADLATPPVISGCFFHLQHSIQRKLQVITLF